MRGLKLHKSQASLHRLAKCSLSPRSLSVAGKHTFSFTGSCVRACYLGASSMPKASGKTAAMLWFRKGLRLHDNPALLEAVKADVLCPVFCLDPWFTQPEKIGINRIKFLLESLEDLQRSLTQRNSGLLVLRGTPEKELPKVWKDWNVTKLHFEFDAEPYAKERDAKITKLAKDAGIEVSTHVSHTLYDLDKLIELHGGSPPASMTQFEKLVQRAGEPLAPAEDPPKHFPPLPEGAASKHSKIPSLKHLGYTGNAQTPYKGGESSGLARMADQLSDKEWVAAFEKPKGNPTAFKKPATTCLSPYLKFGCVSARLLYSQLQSILKARTGYSKPPVSLVGQLYWREFFYTVGHGTPNFEQMKGNPLSKQIAWDENEEYYRAWEDARTGYPWIDAVMTQLREQGWMHHLARHAVACFLTRGDLYISWEKGRDTFEKLLVDADWAVNNGNWMWLSASAFFSQYFRVYSPVTFGQKYDKSGEYVRNFLPVLKDMPDKYIYTPWKAPADVQKMANCIIGKDYPEPIVDHQEIHKVNIGRMKEAYDANKVAKSPSKASQDSPAKKRRKS